MLQTQLQPTCSIEALVSALRKADGLVTTVRFIQSVLMDTTNSGVGVPLLYAAAERKCDLLSAVEAYVGPEWGLKVQHLCDSWVEHGISIDETKWNIKDKVCYVAGPEQDRLLDHPTIGPWVGEVSASIRRQWAPFLHLLMVSHGRVLHTWPHSYCAHVPVQKPPTLRTPLNPTASRLEIAQGRRNLGKWCSEQFEKYFSRMSTAQTTKVPVRARASHKPK